MTKVPVAPLSLQERTRRELSQKSDLIPSLPEVVDQILSLTNDPTAELADFEKILQTDQGLVVKMLQVVNSPFYGLRSPATSIREAVMILGFKSLRSLVLSASTTKHLEASAEVYGHNEKGLWVHALCVASGAHTLAKLTRQSAEIQEEIFVAGLLHDVGKVPLANYMVEAIQGHEGPRLDPETERHVLGIDHQEAGGIVSRKWNLSPMVHEVIERHETGSRGEHRLAVAIVRLSDLYSRELGKGYDASSSRSVSYPEEDLELLGLDEPLWSEAREEMREAMDAALATLGNL